MILFYPTNITAIIYILDVSFVFLFFQTDWPQISRISRVPSSSVYHRGWGLSHRSVLLSNTLIYMCKSLIIMTQKVKALWGIFFLKSIVHFVNLCVLTCVNFFSDKIFYVYIWHLPFKQKDASCLLLWYIL